MRFKFEEKEIEGETWIKFNSNYELFRYKFGNYLILALIIILLIALILFIFSVLPYIDLLKNNPCGLCEDYGYDCIKFGEYLK